MKAFNWQVAYSQWVIIMLVSRQAWHWSIAESFVSWFTGSRWRKRRKERGRGRGKNWSWLKLLKPEYILSNTPLKRRHMYLIWPHLEILLNSLPTGNKACKFVSLREPFLVKLPQCNLDTNVVRVINHCMTGFKINYWDGIKVWHCLGGQKHETK